MILRDCPRQSEVATLLKSGRWPDACEPELRAHVASCNLCRDTVTVKQAFRAALAQSREAARLDSPNLLWWRAQIRRRNAALERVGRPIAGAHRFALAVNLLVAVALIAWLARRTDLWQSWFSQVTPAAFHLEAVASLLQSANLMLLIPCLGLLALLGGVALYLATDRP